MKKTILALFVLITTSVAFSINLKITATSFDSSTAIQYGSAQWIDVLLVDGNYTVSDRVKIYIQFKQNGNYNGQLVKVYDTLYLPYVFNLPSNSDSSKRIYFTMPNNSVSKEFKINVNLSPSNFYGIFENIITGIKSNKNSLEIKEVHYFNLLGIEILEPIGYCIKQTIFEDGTFESKQIFKY